MNKELFRRIKYTVAIAILAFALAGCSGAGASSDTALSTKAINHTTPLTKFVTLPAGGSLSQVHDLCITDYSLADFLAQYAAPGTNFEQIGAQIGVTADTKCTTTEQYVDALIENCSPYEVTYSTPVNIFDEAYKRGESVTAASALSRHTANATTTEITFSGLCAPNFDPSNSLGK